MHFWSGQNKLKELVLMTKKNTYRASSTADIIWVGPHLHCLNHANLQKLQEVKALGIRHSKLKIKWKLKDSNLLQTTRPRTNAAAVLDRLHQRAFVQSFCIKTWKSKNIKAAARWGVINLPRSFFTVRWLTGFHHSPKRGFVLQRQLGYNKLLKSCSSRRPTPHCSVSTALTAHNITSIWWDLHRALYQSGAACSSHCAGCRWLHGQVHEFNTIYSAVFNHLGLNK